MHLFEFVGAVCRFLISLDADIPRWSEGAIATIAATVSWRLGETS